MNNEQTINKNTNENNEQTSIFTIAATVVVCLFVYGLIVGAGLLLSTILHPITALIIAFWGFVTINTITTGVQLYYTYKERRSAKVNTAPKFT